MLLIVSPEGREVRVVVEVGIKWSKSRIGVVGVIAVVAILVIVVGIIGLGIIILKKW